jgi:hypothetical protein
MNRRKRGRIKRRQKEQRELRWQRTAAETASWVREIAANKGGRPPRQGRSGQRAK